ncbi:hypothetical protein [Spirosoma aerolatum]|uniref:hypothetical protein n=1 Tax=Spirosoma aerolatum TaxID=1211326 RepID=UPI0009ABC95B|nr:hypothetical protein [Spirosoma aerolatum]
MQVVFKKSVFLLLGLISLISCRRSVVFVLPEQRARFAEAQTSLSVPEALPNPTDLSAKPSRSVSINNQDTASNQNTAEALVRNDNKISTDNAVRQRFRHTRTWLGVPPATAFEQTAQSTGRQQMTGVQRLLLKKLTKRFRHQRFSTNPAKPVLIEGILVLGAVLLLGGILLILLTSGTGFAIGVIALAAGLVCLLIGLF